MLKVGLKGMYTINVEDTHTAKAMKSGELEVFATPALCACMEAAAVECVRGHIDDGYSTVGSAIEINHIAPSVVGSSITAEAELVEVDAKKLVFKISARDSNGEIGHGTHTRYIVNKAKFMSKAIIRSESSVK